MHAMCVVGGGHECGYDACHVFGAAISTRPSDTAMENRDLSETNALAAVATSNADPKRVASAPASSGTTNVPSDGRNHD